MNLIEKEVPELVNKYFSLSKEGSEVFKKNFYSPDIAKEYAQFNLDENFRKYWRLDLELAEEIDEGWEMFKGELKEFIEYYDITYENFVNNKVMINKNSVKLQKALKQFCHKFKVKTQWLSIFSMDIFYFINGIKNMYCAIDSSADSRRRHLVSTYNSIINYLMVANNVSFEEGCEKGIICYSTIEKRAEEEVDKVIARFFERVNAIKLPTKQKLYLVFTKNPIDMLSCSTGENWSSCLNLFGDYTYWSGLPTTIIDKSRGMFYVTDKTRKIIFPEGFEKGKYSEIKVDRMLTRSWSFIVEKIEEDGEVKTGLNIVKFYPNANINFKKMIKKVAPNTLYFSNYKIKKNKWQCYSKYPITPVFTKKGNAQIIYQDNSSLKIKDNKVFYKIKYNKTRSLPSLQTIGFSNNQNNKEVELTVKSSYPFIENISEGLYNLYESSIGLEDIQNFCYSCGECLLENDEIYEVDGEWYCSDCFFERFVICANCGEYIEIDEAYEVDDEWYCSSCHSEGFTVCEFCNEEYPNEDLFFLESGLVACNACLNEYFSPCSDCGAQIETKQLVNGLCRACLAKKRV